MASTPSMGLRLDPHVTAGSTYFDAVGPLFTQYFRETTTELIIEEIDALSCKFSTPDGYNYGFDPAKVFIDFHHKLKLRRVSGGTPTAELISRPEPFTKLLDEVAERLIAVTQRLPLIKSRSLWRVGVITRTAIAAEELPPGIARFLEYWGRPWEGKVDALNIHVTAVLDDNQKHSDRCIHAISKIDPAVVKDGDEDDLITVNFDWQRVFKSGRPTAENTLREICDDAKAAALAYFEDLAEGNRFDEKLISKSA